MGKINVVWIRPEEKSLDETHKDKPFTASVGFLVPPTLRRWATDYKKFENVGHLHALRFKENPVIVQRGHGYLKTNIRETSPTIHGNDFAGNHPVLLSEGVKAIKFERTEKAKKERSENRKKGKDSNSFSDKKIGFRNDDLMTTLTTAANKDNLLFESQVIRRLTEIECERLQGFPDDWTKYGMFDGVKKEIAKTQRYKMCGNAVSVPVVQMVGERILKGLKL